MAYTKRKSYLQVSPTTTTQQHDDYWKLNEPDPRLTVTRLRCLLKSRGYAIGQTTDKEWLRDSLIRSDLGLMSYVPYSNDELRDIISARGIDPSKLVFGPGAGTRGELVEFLDKADQQPRFHRFLDLPAEIRNRIYTMHIYSFDEPEVTPSQPPITLTNRQIRSETIEMFYRSLKLPVEFHRRPRSMLTFSGETTIPRVLPNHIRAFFQCTPPGNIALIRRFRFHVTSEREANAKRAGRYDGMTWFEIDLPASPADDAAAKAQVRFPQGPWEPSVSAPRILDGAQVVREEMAAAVDVLGVDEGRNVLDLEMVLALRRVMEMGP